jgi:hypothetical protein
MRDDSEDIKLEHIVSIAAAPVFFSSFRLDRNIVACGGHRDRGVENLSSANDRQQTDNVQPITVLDIPIVAAGMGRCQQRAPCAAALLHAHVGCRRA